MTELSFQHLIELVRIAHGGYHKLVIIAGPSGVGKTRLLHEVSSHLSLPLVNLSLLTSQRLLSLTHRQRMLKAEEMATEVIDEHYNSGLCLDNTELLFDSTLKLNPLVFLQDISRNRLIVATWNGISTGGELRYGQNGHPDHFSQSASGYPVVSVTEDKLQLA